MGQKYGSLPKFAHNLREFNNQVLYSGFYWDEREIQVTLESLLFGDWSINGVKVAEFERQFSKKINNSHSLMLNSGSSANLVMLAGLKKRFGWKDDIDEVAVSTCSFPTSVSIIPQNRLKPLFLDINWDDLNIDLDEFQRKITKNTRAIIYAPTLGNPGQLDKLLEICARNNIHIIGDFCDSLGSKFNGKELYEYSIAASTSFFASHHLSCIQAGMISSNDEELIKICRSMSMWSRQCYCRGAANLLKLGTCKKRFSPWLKTQPDIIIDDKYYFTERGYNLQSLEFQGAIGIEQLKKWDEIHGKRKEHHRVIQGFFEKYIKDIKFPTVHLLSEPSWFGVGIITKDYEQKRRLVDYLENNKVQTRNYFSGNILEHPGYSDLANWKLFARASETLRRVFFVGCSPSYTDKHLNYIESVLSKWTN